MLKMYLTKLKLKI